MKKLSFLIVFAVMICCYLGLVFNNQERFDKLESQYKDKTAVNLDSEMKKGVLSRILLNNGYVPTEEDAVFIAAFLEDKLAKQDAPEALFDLKMRKWQMPSALIDSCGTPSLRTRLDEIRLQTGWTNNMDSLYHIGLPSMVDIGEGKSEEMVVTVKDPVPTEGMNLVKRVWKKMWKTDKVPAEGVLVRLNRIGRIDNGSKKEIESTTIAYGMTDKNGQVRFRGLAADSSYSVLPVMQNMTYGAEKGTYLGNWGAQVEEGRTEYGFVSYPLHVRLFTDTKLVSMRDDGLVTVRTPKQFGDMLTNYLMMFLAGWMLLIIIGNTGGRKMDNLLGAGIMLISGLSMLLMFGINDPITGKVLGEEMGQGCIGGLGVMILMMNVDFKKFFQNKYKIKFDFFTQCWNGMVKCLNFLGMRRLLRMMKPKISKALTPMPNPQTGPEKVKAGVCKFLRITHKGLGKTADWLAAIPGIGYFWTAVTLMVALLLFGQEVGGMKVNLYLGFTFQPSEIVKYILVFFMAVFFFEKADSIVRYSEDATDLKGFKNAFLLKLGKMGPMLLVIGVMVLFYLVLKDMGPALVVSLSFIILYSIIKSRIGAEDRKDESLLHQIIHSDFSMLVIGVASFILCMYIGNSIYEINGMKLMGALWLGAWIAYGWFTKKRFYETAFMFNLIIFLFIMGEEILTGIGLADVGSRLAERNSMCFNTWGSLEEGPAINTQVAEGMWALASGGFFGQGLGNAQAHYIPAFHTDMILQSIGEVFGFMGVAGVFVLLSLLLRRAVLAGYRSNHPFLLYLCMGIALVTGVQLFIIACGSLSILPLTGVCVPFMSYGRVSFVLNCLAFGVVLSISARAMQSENKKINQYNETVGVLSLVYTALAAFVLLNVVSYQIQPNQDEVLKRPVYVYDTSGAAVMKYNPRINFLMSKMKSGDIYDRNGILLATSDAKKLTEKTQAAHYKNLGLTGVKELTERAQRRYYPFGEHLFFMLGDYNNQFYFSSVDKAPYGYLAEARHMSDMRGYDNRKKDENGNYEVVQLSTDKFKRHKFLPEESEVVPNFQMRDYSVLLPFLKEGYNSELVRAYNNGEDTGIPSNLLDENGERRTVMPKDIQLTLDAELQMKLQNGIPAYFKSQVLDKNGNYTFDPNVRSADGKKQRGVLAEKYRRYQRFSIVVMDAEQGDMLASAVWPLPDYDRLAEANGEYSDAYKPLDWTSYTERDLGLTRPTNPGSTAKIMSAMAGIMHHDSIGKGSIENVKYKVLPKERIHIQYGAEPTDWVNMKDAIVKSSNVYFINLVNDKQLYGELAQIYGQAGMRVDNISAYGNDIYPPVEGISEKFTEAVTAVEPEATMRYRNYRDQRMKKGGVVQKMRGDNQYAHDAWTWAWGEGTLEATPAAMARVAATAATGYMPETRFCFETDKVDRHPMLKNKTEIELLRDYMKEQANSLGDSRVGGKTGTPEDVFKNDSIHQLNYEAELVKAKNNRRNPLPKEKVNDWTNKNDVWYIAFVDDAYTPVAKDKDGNPKTDNEGKPKKGKLAVAIRIERVLADGSGYAMDIMRRVVLPTLKNTGYLK